MSYSLEAIVNDYIREQHPKHNLKNIHHLDTEFIMEVFEYADDIKYKGLDQIKNANKMIQHYLIAKQCQRLLKTSSDDIIPISDTLSLKLIDEGSYITRTKSDDPNPQHKKFALYFTCQLLYKDIIINTITHSVATKSDVVSVQEHFMRGVHLATKSQCLSIDPLLLVGYIKGEKPVSDLREMFDAIYAFAKEKEYHIDSTMGYLFSSITKACREHILVGEVVASDFKDFLEYGGLLFQRWCYVESDAFVLTSTSKGKYPMMIFKQHNDGSYIKLDSEDEDILQRHQLIKTMLV